MELNGVHPVFYPKINDLSRIAVMPECRAAWRMSCTIADSNCSSTMQMLTSISRRSMPIRHYKESMYASARVS